MALSNQERVSKALDLLKEGLRPFVERELKAQHAQMWFEQAKQSINENTANLFGTHDKPNWDIAALLSVMWNQWNLVFRKTLGAADRSLVQELRDARNRWAHQNPFSSDDAYRTLDSAGRLLTAVSAPQADEIEKMKTELLRVRFEEQARTERRKTTGAIESQVTGSLKPWREVVTPHKDVASGQYQQAEFAADLWQVHLGEGSDEYRKPDEFFRRTFLTDSLKHLLTGAVRRLSSQGGDPVVQLQTNFGGGKTHSMLALYHLFSGAKPGDLSGVDAVLADTGLKSLPKVNRVVLVGNKISPGNPVVKADGTVVRTLWGELAWQLGFAAGGAKEAKRAFQRVAADDEKATSPGDALRELMNQYGPCLILIDEWVAYARQLHDQSDLPGGSFETHFSFAQTLTESARAAKNCLLVISLPASDTAGSPHTIAEDVEVGGERGRAALDRLRNAVGRVEASWRPASAEEGFEIVRRRLFEPIVTKDQFVSRDNVARAFCDFYRSEEAEFPREVRDSEYETRMKAAYPIHPEIFDRLYNDWSTLVKFQRTRGVLRLMAAVIHTLWERHDRNPLILPCNIAIEDRRVQWELTRYLSDNWTPVIEKDVDGPNSLPLQTDTNPNLGKYAAARRVARTIYLGSAPTATAANRGIEDRRVRLGSVMPGEPIKVFDDALRRLASSATYLYHDGARYWYSTQPTVRKMAEDRAEQYKREPDKVALEIERRVKDDLKNRGDFRRVHPLPHSGHEVPDDLDARLVVLGIDHPCSKEPNNAALATAKAILDFRGNTPRIFRNTLVFLAVDSSRLQDLDEAVRYYLAWHSITAEKDTLDLTPQQVKQAEEQRKSADGVVASRLPETYQWLLVPTQASPQSNLDWQQFRLSGSDALAVRASKKLRNDDLLVTRLAGTVLKTDLDKIPLWRGDYVAVKQLTEDYGKYPYLSRLGDPQVLIDAVVDGVSRLTWQLETFAYADSYDEATARYLGLRGGARIDLGDSDAGLIVKAELARKQMDADAAAVTPAPASSSGTQIPTLFPNAVGASTTAGTAQAVATATAPKRFHGSVDLDPTRVGRDAGRIADEVISHVAGLMGSKVTVTLEVQADVPAGVPEKIVRTVTENCRTLKFNDHGFEET